MNYSRTILFFLCSAISAFAADSWPGVPFVEVRAFAWPGGGHLQDDTWVFLPGMKPKPGAVNEGGTLLTADQVKRLQQAARMTREPYRDPTGCHFPHNAFVFYDARKESVACAEICFMCGTHRQQPNPKPLYVHFDLLALATLFDELKLPMGMFPNLEAYKKRNDAPPAK